MRYAIIENGEVIDFLLTVNPLPAHKLHSGLLPVIEATLPDGKIMTGATYEIADGSVTVVPILADPPPQPVPTSIHKLYIMRALKALGKWTDFRALLDSNPDALDEWEATTNVQRSHPLVAGMAQAYGWGDAELDTLFLAARQAELAA